MMAARRELPVSEVLFLFFTGRGGSFLSPKEKEKNGAQIGRTGPPAPAWCSENKKGRVLLPPDRGNNVGGGYPAGVYAPAGFSVGVRPGMIQDTFGISLCCSGSAVCPFSMQPMSV